MAPRYSGEVGVLDLSWFDYIFKGHPEFEEEAVGTAMNLNDVTRCPECEGNGFVVIKKRIPHLSSCWRSVKDVQCETCEGVGLVQR